MEKMFFKKKIILLVISIGEKDVFFFFNFLILALILEKFSLKLGDLIR